MPSFLVTHGHHFGVRYELLDHTTIGRSSTCSIQLLDEKVSRVHCSIRRIDDRYVLQDEGSANGTGMNGRLVMEMRELSAGDEVAVGNNLLLFEPELEIVRDLAGTGAVVIVPRVDPAVPTDGGDDETATFRAEALLTALSNASGAEGGQVDAAGLAEAFGKGLGADRVALLALPRGGERAKAISVWPQRARVCIARQLLDRVQESGKAIFKSEGIVELSIRNGRSYIESRPGGMLLMPIVSRGQLFGAVYADARRSGAFKGLSVELLHAAAGVAFAPLLARSIHELCPPLPPKGQLDPVADSEAMRPVRERARACGDSAAPVLLTGEPGSGKETLARWIHDLSGRNDSPFVAVHCAELPPHAAEAELFGYEAGAFQGADEATPGALERSNGGTIFFDDVAELPPAMQIKLLRTLQEDRFYRVGGTRPVRVDVRILTATHRNLDALVRSGHFREDLARRLDVLRVEVPPLRRRIADIPALVGRFVDTFNRDNGLRHRGFTPEALGHLEAHDWPGNVRELRAAVQRLLVRSATDYVEAKEVDSELAALPTAGGHPPERPLREAVAALEKERIARALGRARGNKARASAMLGMERAELDRLVVLHEVDLFGK